MLVVVSGIRWENIRLIRKIIDGLVQNSLSHYTIFDEGLRFWVDFSLLIKPFLICCTVLFTESSNIKKPCQGLSNIPPKIALLSVLRARWLRAI